MKLSGAPVLRGPDSAQLSGLGCAMLPSAPVAPGPTGTDLFLNGKSQDEIDRLAGAVPLERLGSTARTSR